MSASVTARELARESIRGAIKAAARHQVAVDGAAKLSVRAVAREVGMVSSAVYRYFPTRDDLLTALIVDAYDALGAAVELADAGVAPAELRARWRAACRAVRRWAVAHPQEYGLIFGSPVPGYLAPPDTIAPAARVPTALLAILHDGWTGGTVRTPAVGSPPAVALSRQLGRQLALVAAELAPGLPPALVLRLAVAWTQLFGMVTFELFGQLVGSLDPADEFFDASVELMADLLGIG